MNQQPTRRFNFFLYILTAFALIILIGALLKEPEHPSINYSEVRQQFIAENVKSFYWKDGVLTLELHREPDIDKDELKGVTTVSHKLADTTMFSEELHELYEAQLAAGIIEGYNFEPVEPTPWYLTILPYALVMVVLLVVMYFLFGRAAAGGGQAPKFSRAAVRIGTGNNKVTFADVAGADEEKAELEEIVDFLRSPDKYRALGAKIPKGVLLVGPPGTGKTLLAKAVAGEADVSFLSISGSDFVELYVGVGASRVRDLFEQAKKLAPAIVFIDEIDAVGRRRGAGMGGGHDEREQTLNQLLVEMDGFAANEGVIVLAATNRHDILDPALLRPGRFDRQIYVSAPDQKGREEILKIHARNKSLAEDVDLKVVAQSTTGFTGADLENLLNEAALLTARKNCPVITMSAIEDAILKVIAGPEKRSRVQLERDRRITAYHEAGHAISRYFLSNVDPVHAITIVQRGRALGMTIYLPEEDSSHYSRNQMRDELVSLLGGRVAEALEFDDITTGASSDLKRASNIARNMIARFGMSEKLGAVSFENDDEIFVGRDYERTKAYSEETAALIDNEMKIVISEAYRRCEEILKANYNKLHEVSQFLLDHEYMSRKQFEACMKGEPIPDTRESMFQKSEECTPKSEENPQ